MIVVREGERATRPAFSKSTRSRREFFKEKTLIPRVEIALPTITCCVNLGQIVFLWPSFPLKKEMAIHSSILAWKISWREEPGGL